MSFSRKAFDIIGKLASGYRNESGYVVVMQQPDDSGKNVFIRELKELTIQPNPVKI